MIRGCVTPFRATWSVWPRSVSRALSTVTPRPICVRLMGTTPSYGAPRLCFPPDARSWCGADSQFVARPLSPSEDAESASRSSRGQCVDVGHEWSADACTSRFELEVGRPICFLGMRPSPIPWSAWNQVKRPIANAQGVSTEWVDECCEGVENLSKCAKRPPRGGDMHERGSRDSSNVRSGPIVVFPKMRMRYARVAMV